ncbi:MAG TPA: hypothetical protein EYP29_04085 [Thermoplasmata archaeon]|nr:hypothetical protein [Thermoplasmata archaeon]
MNLKIHQVKIEKDKETNIILGQSHFIKTAEDLFEAALNSVPEIQVGIAFCEASMDRLVRVEGNDEKLKSLAAKNAYAIGAGHTFIMMIKKAFPINLLGAVKAVPEVCFIYCATANDVTVLVGENEQGRGIIGVVDGQPPLGIEKEEDREKRRRLLREVIKYKLGV